MASLLVRGAWQSAARSTGELCDVVRSLSRQDKALAVRQGQWLQAEGGLCDACLAAVQATMAYVDMVSFHGAVEMIV